MNKLKSDWPAQKTRSNKRVTTIKRVYKPKAKRLPKPPKLTGLLHSRCTKGELQAIKRAAATVKQTVSSWLRDIAVKNSVVAGGVK